jgi:hypothetical protein
MSKKMNRQQAADCFFGSLDINASNIEIFERILMLPYVVFCVVAEALCSGELTLEDFDSRLFDLERQFSHVAEKEDVDLEKLVREALVVYAGNTAESAATNAAAGNVSDLSGKGLLLFQTDQSKLIQDIADAADIDVDILDGFRLSGRGDSILPITDTKYLQANDDAIIARRTADEFRSRCGGQPGAANRLAELESIAQAAQARAIDAKKRAISS